MTVRFLPMDPEFVARVRAGGPDANGQPAEVHVSRGAGTPCRSCMRHVPEGARYLILAARPFPGPQPYAETGPIFLCADACEPWEEEGVPPILETAPQFLLKGQSAGPRAASGARGSTRGGAPPGPAPRCAWRRRAPMSMSGRGKKMAFGGGRGGPAPADWAADLCMCRCWVSPGRPNRGLRQPAQCQRYPGCPIPGPGGRVAAGGRAPGAGARAALDGPAVAANPPRARGRAAPPRERRGAARCSTNLRGAAKPAGGARGGPRRVWGAGETRGGTPRRPRRGGW